MKRFLIISGLFFTTHVMAMDAYIETGFGLSRIQSGQNFFGSGIDASPPFSFATNVTLAVSFGGFQTPMQMQLGVKQRMSSADTGGTIYSIMSVYPIFRVEMRRFYVGGGIAPFVWRNTGTSAFNLSGLTKVSGALGYMLEAGVLWKVTPYFHFAFEASFYMMSGSAGLSPKPVIEGTANLRFFLYNAIDSSDTIRKRRGDFDGWRYPFGVQI